MTSSLTYLFNEYLISLYVFLGKQKSVYACSLKFIPSLVHNQNLILFQSDHNEADVGTQRQNEKHRAERGVLPVSVGARIVFYVLFQALVLGSM